MNLLMLRCFWGAFYGLLWLLFGRHVSLIVLFVHIVVFPISFKLSRKVRSECLFAPSLAWPFVKHDNPKHHGLDGARNVSINYESTYDNCTINLGVWHVLPKSLVKKHRFLLNTGTKDELNKLFDEEMKNSEYPIFLYFHGIIGTRASNYRLELYKFLQNLDVHVVTFDYRGFGDSTKVAPTKIGAVEDGLIVYSWIRGLVGSDKPVLIWGHSIGSGLSQRAFSKLKPYSHTLLGLKDPLPPPQGIIIEAGYNSNVELSEDFIGAKLANWVPHFKTIVANTLRGTEDRIIPEDYAARLRQFPLLIMHATNDSVVPYRYGKTLYEKHQEVRKEGDAPVTFKTFEEEGHFCIVRDPRMPVIIEDFIKSCRT